MKWRWIAFFVFTLTINSAFSQDYRLGIITDFERSPVVDSIFSVIVEEMNRTTGSSKTISLEAENTLYGTRSLELSQTRIDPLSNRVDLVLLFGAVSVKGAVLNDSFSKPTFGVGIIDPDLQEIPYVNGRSGIDNFTYIWSVKDIRRELKYFHDLFKFDHLAMLVDENSSVTFDQTKGIQLLDSLKALFQTTIDIIPISDNINGSLESISGSVDAVYLTTLQGRTPADIQIISNNLKEKNIPSFSGSKWHVDNGILASISDENDLGQVIRKLSIMVDEALQGEDLSTMNVLINFKEDFFLNMRTADEINFYPPFEILFTASMVDPLEESLPTYSIDEIMNKAIEENFDIKLSELDIAIAEQDIISARSLLLPDINLSLTGSQINPDQTFPGISAERELSGDLGLSQVIYSEKEIASVKIARYFKKAQEFSYEAQVLSVLLDTYFQYFDVLSLKTRLLIEEENLANSQSNLELAKTRVSVGAASNAEIYRWESEVANAKQSVIAASTQLLQSKFALNNFLGNVLEEEFDIEDVANDDQLFLRLKENTISGYINNPRDFELTMKFLVRKAVEDNPNKKELVENIKAIERERLQNKRLFYIPTFSFQAGASRNLGRGGEGSTEPPGISFIDNRWQLGVGMSYPIFQGNRRKADLERSTIQLDQLNNSEEQLNQFLELNVKQSVLSILAATTNIEYSNISADNAEDNYEIVQNNYKAGSVTITQLIDAQQATLQAKQQYALSIYDYMVAYLSLEFSIGYFSMFATPDKLTEFENEFEEYMLQNR